MDPGLGSNQDSKREVLDVMFSFVMDLADNFDAFLTSKVKPSFSKNLLPGGLWGCSYYQDQDSLLARAILREQPANYLKQYKNAGVNVSVCTGPLARCLIL